MRIFENFRAKTKPRARRNKRQKKGRDHRDNGRQRWGQRWRLIQDPTSLFRIRCRHGNEPRNRRVHRACVHVVCVTVVHVQEQLRPWPWVAFCSMSLLLSSAPAFSANVGPRIFMVSSQGLGFEEIRPCNALLTPNSFLRPVEWGSLVSGARGKF